MPVRSCKPAMHACIPPAEHLGRDRKVNTIRVAEPSCALQVSQIKAVIRRELIQGGQALAYSEPESKVVSRSGDECVVALTDQWFLTYGESTWRQRTE